MIDYFYRGLPLQLHIKQELLTFLIENEPSINKEAAMRNIQFDLSSRDLDFTRYNLMLLELYENCKHNDLPSGLAEIESFR